MPQDPIDKLADLARIERLRTSGEARRIRLRAGVSARQLAKALRVQANTVLLWEEGETKPRPAAALAWLRALDRIQAELDKLGDQPEEPPELVISVGRASA